jgi:tetratricopeptide (TPR) repeat protein
VAAIAQEVGPWLTGHWLATSRFREVRELSLQTLALGPHARTLVHLARAKRILGEVQDALEHYRTALHLYTEVGDRAGLATTLTNNGSVYNGSVYNGLGDRQQALRYYQQALPIWEEVGDLAGESVTRYNMAMIYRVQGQFAEAVAALRQAVALDEQVQHSDLESGRAVLRQVEQEWRASLQ